jgi:hypothetical protein
VEKILKIKSVLALMSVIVVLLLVVAGIFVVGQILFLQKAHSTFESYYNFRGCVQLISTTTDSGICRTGSGQMIKMVKFDGKWYLDGDLPHPGFNFL